MEDTESRVARARDEEAAARKVLADAINALPLTDFQRLAIEAAASSLARAQARVVVEVLGLGPRVERAARGAARRPGGPIRHLV